MDNEVYLVYTGDQTGVMVAEAVILVLSLRLGVLNIKNGQVVGRITNVNLVEIRPVSGTEMLALLLSKNVQSLRSGGRGSFHCPFQPSPSHIRSRQSAIARGTASARRRVPASEHNRYA